MTAERRWRHLDVEKALNARGFGSDCVVKPENAKDSERADYEGRAGCE